MRTPSRIQELLAATTALKPAKPMKPVIDKVQKPIEDKPDSNPADVNVSASVVRGMQRTKHAKRAPSAYAKPRSPKSDTKPVEVKPAKMMRVLAPKRNSNDVPDAKNSVIARIQQFIAGKPTMINTASLNRMLSLEVAADGWFSKLSKKEQEVYRRAHPGSKYAKSGGQP